MADEQPTPAAPAAAVDDKATPVASAGQATPTDTKPAEATEAKRKRRPGVPPRRGKKLRSQLRNQTEKVGKELRPVRQALATLKSCRRAKFDETVEVHISLGIDSTQSDQNIRGSVTLPHGIGKSVRVLVFTQGDNVQKAKDAGADFVGGAELVAKIQQEQWLEFDVALATQDMMGQVSRLGKLLGPRGLMPTPKSGTVVPMSQDISNAVREFKAGKVEYRSDKGGNVHAGVGKISFDDAKLIDNINAFIDQIRLVKPSGVKGNYILTATISSTMGPGVALAL